MPPALTAGLVEPFSEGLAYQDTLDPPNPSAGANLPITIGGENWIRVLSCIATLSTDANAANRFVSLDFINARGVTYVRNAVGVVVIANVASQVFAWSEQLATGQAVANTTFLAPVSSLFLPPMDVIQLTVDNKQAGDTLTNVHFVIERYPTGPRGQPVGVVLE